MELHETIRELVAEHGRSVLEDATGFRGLLDDVLAEQDATTGEINLLVDAIRFDAVNPLVAMIDGGADPDRAVQEAGLRLARNRGGDDHGSASWAAAVLGYALDKVPSSVLARYRSQGPQRGTLPYSAPGGATTPPPSTSPAAPYTSPAQPGFTAPPPSSGQPGVSAPQGWPGANSQPSPSAQPGPSSQPGPTAMPGLPGGSSGAVPPPPASGVGSTPRPDSVPRPESAYSYGGYPGGGAPSNAPKKRGAGLWIALAAVLVLLVGGGVIAAVALSGGSEDPDPGPDEPAVDLSAEALDERYAPLSRNVSSVGGECTAPEPEEGQAEVVECVLNAGTLRLVTYDSAEAMQAVRDERVDTRPGTLSDKDGTSAFYEFDPENTGSEEPAVIYWDNTAGPQSAELIGGDGTELATIEALFTNTGPTIDPPTAPSNDLVRDFIGINMKVADCSRGTTYGEGATEESVCTPRDDISVVVGRYETRREMLSQRRYYRRTWRLSDNSGESDFWRFGTDGAKEGAYFGYEESGTSTLYWDWDKKGCNCYAVAFGYDVALDDVNSWWAGQ